MKKIFFIAILGLLSISSFAQQTVDLTLRWNTTLSRYEVYGKTNFTQSNFTWGPTQVTVVPPASAPNVNLNVTSHNAGAWTDNTDVYAPAAAPSSDFHAVATNGALTPVTSGQEILLFSFTWPDGQCRDGLRLFINGTDPNSSAAGMGGGDYGNSVDNGFTTEIYRMNYANTGTLCKDCGTIVAPELIK